MNKFIVLLRGVNVSGSNIIKMAELKQALVEAGFHDAVTYIQSGNIVLSSELSNDKITSEITELIKSKFGFDVPVLVLTTEELIKIRDSNPLIKEEEKCYFVFLYSLPATENVEKLASKEYPNEEYVIRDKVIYLLPRLGLGKAKLNNNVFENKLKVTATARNLNTVNKLIQLAK